MNIKELRTGNIVVYEACSFMVMETSIVETERLRVKPVKHDWEIETCGVNEVEGLPIDEDWLKKNGFNKLNEAFPFIWVKQLPGYRYIRYHEKVHYMEFEHLNNYARVPWAIIYMHQMQNACTDYGLDIEFKV